MNSTIKISTGSTMLLAGIAFLMNSIYLLNFDTYGGLVFAIGTIFAIIITANWMLSNPNILSTIAFGGTTTMLCYLLYQNHLMKYSMIFFSPMVVCFCGLYFIINGINNNK